MISTIIKKKNPSYYYQHLSRSYATVGIRREDKSRWERRSALTPNTVKKLIDETGTQVYVQPSTKRIFTNESYEKVIHIFMYFDL